MVSVAASATENLAGVSIPGLGLHSEKGLVKASFPEEKHYPRT